MVVGNISKDLAIARAKRVFIEAILCEHINIVIWYLQRKRKPIVEDYEAYYADYEAYYV